MPEFDLSSQPFSMVKRVSYGVGALLSGGGMLYGAYMVYLSLGLWGVFDDDEADMRTVPYLMTLMGVLLISLTASLGWYFLNLLRRKDRV